MSDVGGTNVATFYFTGNAGGVTNAVNQANNSLATLEKAAARNWWGIRNLGIAFAALPALVGAGTAEAIKSAVQWQDAMAGVARTNFDTSKSVDENNAAISRLSDDLFKIAQNIPQSALTLAQIAESAGALGVAQQDVASFTETVANLTAVTDLSADKAATDLARIAGLLGITSAGYDNLASSITGTGVATAATESDITSIATKISGVAGVVGLTASEVIGLSAAVRSAGVSAIEGGTQVQKSLVDITSAVHNGGKELKAWAALAGLSIDDFRTAFGNDPAQLLVTLAQHMGDLNKSGGDVIGMLKDAGVTEQRQLRTLLLLSQAQSQNANENLKLSHILDVSANSFSNTSAYAEMLRRRYDTVGGQLQILRNIIFQASVAFGNIFLPVIKATIGILSQMINGFMLMPGPVKAVLGVLIGLAAALSGIAAVALLVGPRILIAMGAVSQLQTNLLKTAAAAGDLTVGMESVTRAQLRAAGATGAFIRLLSEEQRLMLANALAAGNLAEVQGLAATAGMSMSEAGFGMAGGLATATSWMGKLGSAAGWVIGILSALAIVMTLFGKNTAKTAENEAKLMRSQPALIDALRKQRKGAADAGEEWLKTSKRYQQVIKTADQLGISHDKVLNIIRGGGGATEMQKTLNDLKSEMDSGNESAKKAYENLRILQGQYTNSAQEAGVLTQQDESLGKSLGDVGQGAADAKKQLQAFHDLMEQEAQAASDYVDALFSQKQAEFAVRDAEIALEQAQYDAANTADRLAQAERDVVESRIAQRKAAEDLIDAERKLETARADAENTVLDLQDQLADANDRYLDTLDKIQSDEEAIEKLRAGSSLKEIIKLTNDLRQAELNLTKAQLGVQDAQWQLNYLMEEGASNRDILNAQNALEQSQIDLTDATTEQADAQQALADASDPLKQAEELDKAERTLAADRRDAAATLRDITTLETNLANAREDLASNRAVIDAEDAVQAARDAVADAAQRSKDAEHALDQERRNDTSALDLAKAEQTYQQSLLDLAKANTDVRKEQALMNGETWDAGRAAHTLAEELGNVLKNVPSDKDTGKLGEFMKTLADAPDVPKIPDDWGADTAAAMGDAFDAANPDGFQVPLGPPKIDSVKIGGSIKDKIMGAIQAILPLLGGLLIRGLVISALAAAGITGGWAALAGAIAGLLGGWLISMFTHSQIGKDIIGGLVDGIMGALHFLKELPSNIFHALMDPLWKHFRILSPSKVMYDLGVDIIQGLIDGIFGMIEKIVGIEAELVSKMLGKFFGIGGWLLQSGKDFLGGLLGGILSGIPTVLGNVGGFIGELMGKFGDTIHWLVGKGADLLTGLWNGIFSVKDWFIRQIGGIIGWITDRLTGKDGLANLMFGFGERMIQGLWDGFISLKDWLQNKLKDWGTSVIKFIGGIFGIHSPSKVMQEFGKNITEGMALGMTDNVKMIAEAGDQMKEELMKSLDGTARRFGPFGVSDLAHNRDVMALSGGSASPVAGSAVTNNYYDHFDLDLETNADPEEIVNAYVWKKRIRTRR